jgi:hypothetical protein
VVQVEDDDATDEGDRVRRLTNHPARRHRAGGHTAKEGHSMSRHLNNLIPAMVLVRLGQELGTASPATRAVHDLIELLASFAALLIR